MKEQPMATDREALTMALACIRWLAFGERRIPEWSGSPPKTSDTLQALRAALAAPPVEQQAAEPDFWTACAWIEGGGEAGWIPLPGYSNETAHGVKSLVLEDARKDGYKGTVTGRLMELGWEVRPVYLAPQRSTPAAQPAPQAGAAEPALRPDIQAVLLELDVPVQGYLASHAGTFLKHAAMMPPEEYPVPLVRESDHRRACRKIAALVTHPTEQPSQDAKDAAKWREHVGKLDALVAFCPTCCEGKVASADMTRDEVIFQCGRTSGKSEAARAAQAQGESKGGTPHG